jgi:DNA sulfur modification protein DndB
MKTTHYPSVKGMIGDWTYYVTVMRVSDIVLYIQFAEQVCPNQDLDMMIQREVSARSKQIAEYLRTQDQRFFGSLIVAVYDGEPKFLPISFSDAPLLNQLEGKLGILQFDGSEQYYVVDGQHRLAALREVVGQDGVRYKNDEISVILISHSKDAEGMARARRLFTTVNRYAKKTSPVIDIVMDEDDGLAIITRRLIRENEFFSSRIKVLAKQGKGVQKLATGEAMLPADKRYLMAIGTLYKCNRNLLPADLEHFFKKQQQLPEYEKLEEGFTTIVRRWDELIEAIPIWRDLKEADSDLEGKRSEKGGHVLARPIGITSFTKAVGDALDAGLQTSAIAKRVERFSVLADTPWAGLLWNTASSRMITGKDREKLASEVWRVLLGLPSDYDAVNAEWRAKVDPRDQHPELNLPNL